MAQLNINIPVDKIAGMINNMEIKELETLCLLLNDDGRELLRRKKEIESEDIRLISRDEVFDV
ncbi:MAG: hypothetical protein WBB70_10855 [Desulfobacterales bacterium]|nr:hypothetical protein [Deltaproteobacteria bacterium]MBW2620836.1 hypothetical protein [Deltaproteobacteria bacterium]